MHVGQLSTATDAYLGQAEFGFKNTELEWVAVFGHDAISFGGGVRSNSVTVGSVTIHHV